MALPAEIIYHILDSLPRSSLGARTLSACVMAGNRLLREVAMDESFWKEYYNNRYKNANLVREAKRRCRSGVCWRVMYVERRRIDCAALESLKALENAISLDKQTELAAIMVNSEFDVWDVLTEEASHALRPPLQTEGDVEKLLRGVPLTNLTRKYWASEIMKVITRGNAIGAWTGLRSGADSSAIPLTFEDAFATLSFFHGVHPDEVRTLLSRESEGCKAELHSRGIVTDSSSPSFSSEILSKAICVYMRSKGYGLPTPDVFLDVKNSLPHLFLTTQKRCLPLSLAWIFVSIAHRLGVRATALNTRGSVCAMLENTVVNIAGVFGNVANEDAAIMGLGSNRYNRFYDLDQQREITLQLLIRASNNIEHAYHSGVGQLESHSASFDRSVEAIGKRMALCLSLVLRRQQSHPIPEFLDKGVLFPLDPELVFRRTGIFGGLGIGGGRGLGVLAEESPRQDMFSGQIVRGYPTGLFYCVIGFMRLYDGEKHCFTLGLTSETSQVKAISDRDGEFSFQIVDGFSYDNDVGVADITTHPLLGLFFKDIETFEDGAICRMRFVMNDFWKAHRPEDDQRGARWLHSGQFH